MTEPRNFIDFYIGYPAHPKYKQGEIIEDDIVRVIIQKYEVLIFTNKGEVFGQPQLGADLYRILHETRISAESVETALKEQISLFIPELNSIAYELDVEFFEDPENFQEIMVVYFNISGIEVFTTVS
jgi:hypothetical protein